MTDNEMLLTQLIQSDPWRMDILRTVRALDLRDWLIGAGFVRNLIWDHVHGYIDHVFSSDIDVAYFNPSDLRESTEDLHQQELTKHIKTDWSVTNQARMATLNHQARQYISTEDTIAHWPETATAVGVRLEVDDSLTIIAPYGVDDLFNLVVRMSPGFGDGLEEYRKRIIKKNWITRWSKLNIIH